MGQPLFDEVSNWVGGVITNARPDQLRESNAFPRGRNCQLYNIGGGEAIIATRPGLTLMNASQITGGGTVLRQVGYRRYATGAFTNYHLIVTDTGRLKKMTDSDGTLADADGGNPTPFTAGQNYPDVAQAVNCVYFVNGIEMKKFNGTNVQGVGITAPSAPTVADSGGAGTPNGSYDFAYTYYNSAIGQESSLSAFNSVTVTNHTINVTVAASADTQVDTIRLYIRKGALSGSFFRCDVGVTPSVNANDGFANSNATIVVNISDTQINGLINIAPTTSENNPPPTLDRIEFHQSRLFGVAKSDPSTLVFSKLSTEGIESFNPTYTIPVNVSDGDRIMALQSTNEMLVIFKTRSIYILVGSYPDWQLRLLTNEVGCVSHLALASVNNVTYFWSLLGPVSWFPGTSPQLLAQPNMANAIDQSALNFNLLSKISCGYHDQSLRVLWSVPGLNDTRNTIIIPFNTLTNSFESDQWNMIDTASLATILDQNNAPQLFFGDYNGRVFRFDTTVYADGVPSGTTTGTGSTTSYTSNTLTDTGASFYTTGNGLAQLYVYAFDAHGDNIQRKRIGSNTGTVITLDSGVTWDTTPDTSWTYVVGGIDFEFDFGWNDFQQPLYKKRMEYLLVDCVPPSSSSSVITLYLDLFTNFVTTSVFRSLSIPLMGTGAKWDVGLFDAGLWGGGLPILHSKLRMAGTARTYLIRVKCFTANAPVALTRIGATASLQSMKA